MLITCVHRVSFLFSPRDALGVTEGERRCSCPVHVYLFYEPSKKTARWMVLASSARLRVWAAISQGACAFLDESLAWVLRKSLFDECTTSVCNSPLLKPFCGGGRYCHGTWWINRPAPSRSTSGWFLVRGQSSKACSSQHEAPSELFCKYLHPSPHHMIQLLSA